jgi:DNA integrity scanning protein DisA with diadenylate cyclase activity|tara:strand:+ start:143 stop:523 length:381 start_codon:yes stop_codon:yes gene_type:complete
LNNKLLLAVIELGGYPDFRDLYQQFGYEVVIESSMRKALSLLKKKKVDVIVAEFNYQHTFRDRLSSLESIIAVAQTNQQIEFIVLYEKEFENHLDKLRRQFNFSAEVAFPIDEKKMTHALEKIAQQ